MTYWEAKAAGRHVSPLPSETGIRPCTEADYSHPGFKSAEAIEQASDEDYAKWGEAEGPTYCQDDPRTLLHGTWPGRRSLTAGAAVRREEAQAEVPPLEGAQLLELEEEEEESEGGGEGGDESGDRETDAG